MIKNDEIEDRISLVAQLRKAESWLEEWAAAPGLSDGDIEDRIRIVNRLRSIEAE